MDNQKYQLSKLTNPGEQVPLIFCYDYLPFLPSTLRPSPWGFENPCKDWEKTLQYQQNAITVNPQAANLPFHSGLNVRANRFFVCIIEYTETLCKMFAADENLRDIPLLNGTPLADIAIRQLRKPPMERFIVSTIYLFPYASKDRLRLIAASAVLIVFFDDVQQEIKDNMLYHALGNYNNHLANASSPEPSHSSPFQKFTSEMMDEFNTADATTDTGGCDVIDTMYEWIAHEQPKERFDSVTQYMMYRWNDSAFKWICACVKFSIASEVDLNDARLATFMHLAGNHFSLVNDLASFEKETQEFQSGEAAFVINVVDVLQRQHGIDVREAKAKAYSMQLEIENHIEEDLEQLKKRDLLSLEEWRFVNAVVVMLGGHVFYCMTASRYGGEKSRIT